MQPIIQVIGSGSIGGGTTVVLGLSQGLANQGIPVVVASDRGSYLIKAARDSGLATLELDFGQRSSTPVLAIQLARAFQQIKPSLVHAHGARAGLPAALMPASSRGTLVYTVHGFHYPSKSARVRPLARQAERFCIGRAAVTVFVSDHDRLLAARDSVMGRRSCYAVIHNGSSSEIPVLGGMPEAGFDIAFIGRLHPQKNPLALVDILLALRPLQPTLGIIGDGECEAALRERLLQAGLAHQVRFYGPRPPSEALAILSQAKVVVLPSTSEGLPLVVIEAMHLGIPTVASYVGGVGELINDGETGFLIQPGDTAAFTERLRCLLLNEPKRLAMGRAGRERAKFAFSLQRNLDHHVALYGYLSKKPIRAEPGLFRVVQGDT